MTVPVLMSHCFAGPTPGGETGRGVLMSERQLRELIAVVKAGRFSRRTFVRRMVGFGLTAPLVTGSC